MPVDRGSETRQRLGEKPAAAADVEEREPLAAAARPWDRGSPCVRRPITDEGDRTGFMRMSARIGPSGSHQSRADPSK